VRVIAKCTCLPAIAKSTLTKPCMMCQAPITRDEKYVFTEYGKFHFSHFTEERENCGYCAATGKFQTLFEESIPCPQCGGTGHMSQFAAEWKM
jgi:hypothetical protein